MLININEASKMLNLSPRILRRLETKNMINVIFNSKGNRNYDYDYILNYKYEKRRHNYWTKELCAKEALKFNSRIEFQTKSKGGYIFAFRNKLLDEICKHMIKPLNHNKIWFKETCKEEALKYTKKVDFYKNALGAYKAALANNWLDEICDHMLVLKMPNNYWTKELIEIEANKYTTRQEFCKKSKPAYVAASKNNWLNDVCNHMKICGNVLKRCIYVYEFSDNYAYVGLTCNYNRRQHEHLMKNKSPISKHISETNLIPKTFIISDGYIYVKNAQYLEKEIYLKYKNNGWNMLNSNRTGGIGSQKLPKL